jgi:hypothetical protein
MKRLLTGLTAASLLIGLPLAAAAGDDHGRGWGRHGHHGYWKGPKYARHYYSAPPVVYYPAPRVVYRPVYVPAPVVARPVYVPPPPPVVDGPRVSVGFRFFF